MPVKILTAKGKEVSKEVIRQAAQILKEGGLVALPTETVYGLAASLRRKRAVRRLRQLKERPETEAFPVQIASPRQLEELVDRMPLIARPLIRQFWPGPLTIVFPRAKVTAGGQGIGVRVPAHPVALAVLREVREPLCVPSANPRGKPPACTAKEVAEYFPEEVDLIVDGGRTAIGQPSTVIRIRGRKYEILREGLISRDMIHRLIGGETYLFVCTGNTCRSPMASRLAQKIFGELTGLSRRELTSLGFRFLSAGTAAQPGLRASEKAREAIAEVGLSLEDHRTTSLSPELIRQADHIFCMSGSHLRRVLELVPEAERKTKLLAPGGIPDPVGEDLEGYRQVLRQIEKALREIWRGKKK